ncbi:hypothetical protein YPPY15_4490 [Yersinia pestis PY-15]|uniref:Transposase n=1 Tax=Yersinia pestis biovar Orientalis str. IP275 TaxID=373665 RepID=A0AAV3BL23_YERPE|nr:hypothetical protein YPIP275_4544 [Yersinia pestis biovar Orientalis str. IP275]EDR38333.1 hypothetical protein YpF1991016_4458 [Yersinia pestis biovar Orientalis str. F1991016]EDR43698.1 hypothetical protein YpE1979001_3796 [Yersinia pestis biovar Antiqua str. E1979001]EDR57194.1 hypothetical protein YpMG051020_1388 [Yersinia pestis biovar Orientalis str. MG05-1020]EIQ83452.1 hypothetical protein YPPY01_4458 [Yersinia pestis PY-01]EIR42051.1 hypothetical protein YPPY15_4490 [Yersinia pesti
MLAVCTAQLYRGLQRGTNKLAIIVLRKHGESVERFVFITILGFLLE